MMRPSAVLLMLVIGIASLGWISSANANIDPANPWIMMYQDEFEDPWDYYVEADPGDTVKVWMVINHSPSYWSPANRVRAGLWWDTAVIANPGSGDGSVYVTPDYTGSWPIALYDHVEDPNYTQPQMNHYAKIDMWERWDQLGLYVWEEPASNPYRVVGWNIPIRPDAPAGETKIGIQLITTGLNVIIYEEEGDFGVTINVSGLPPVGVPGDFDDNGHVDAADLQDLCDNMGGAVDPYDVDESGYVDGDDLIFLIENLVEWDNGVDTGVGTKQGDFNLDGVVNATDLAIMKGTFGTSGVNYADGNANCDDLVNATDLAILKGTFGFVAPPGGGVPEPMTIGLLALGGIALLRRKKK